MRIALTGTPGAGKSTVAALLREQGETVIDLKEWSEGHHAIQGTDADGTVVIDPDALTIGDFPTSCIIDSHISHALDVDVVWLIRIDPRILRGRLEQRGYAPAKVQENLEAEAMDLILQEAIVSGRVVIQRDGTQRTPEELLTAFRAATTEGIKSSDLDAVDWSDALLDGL